MAKTVLKEKTKAAEKENLMPLSGGAAQTQNSWSQQAANAINSVPAPVYAPSENTINYQNMLSQYEGNQPVYNSQYKAQIDALMDKITNRPDFTYNFDADPLYQQYKDQYTTQGKIAANNAAAAASSLTGGYGNSYATTAAAQANQQYLTQINDVIPDLYNAALAKYNSETDNLYNQFNMYGSAEDRAFNQYQTELNQFNANRDYYSGRYDSSVANDQWKYGTDYNAYRDKVSDNEWKFGADYNAYRDSIADSQYDQNFNYQKEQDAINNALNQAQFDLTYEQWLWQKQQAEEAKKKAASGGGSSSKSSKSSGTDVNMTDNSGSTSGVTTQIKSLNNIQKMKQNGASDYDLFNAIQNALHNKSISEKTARELLDKYKIKLGSGNTKKK